MTLSSNYGDLTVTPEEYDLIMSIQHDTIQVISPEQKAVLDNLIARLEAENNALRQHFERVKGIMQW